MIKKIVVCVFILQTTIGAMQKNAELRKRRSSSEESAQAVKKESFAEKSAAVHMTKEMTEDDRDEACCVAMAVVGIFACLPMGLK